MKKSQSQHFCTTSLLALLATMMLAGCSDASKELTVASQEKRLSLEESLQQIETKNDGVIAEGIRHLAAHDYKAASRVFNSALMDDAGNPALNYLNGLTYHLMAENVSKGNYELAIIGYHRALTADPAYWPAMLQLGRIFTQEKKFKEAQDMFAQVLLIKPNHSVAMHELAMASYYAYDLPHATHYIQGALKQEQNNTAYYRSAAVIFAAAGDSQKAAMYLQQYRKREQENRNVIQVTQRIQDWRRVHEKGEIYLAAGTAPEVEEPKIKQEEFEKMSSESAPSAAGEGGQPGASGQPGVPGQSAALATPPKPHESPMVTMDGVVLRVSEYGTTNKGINLLQAFTNTILSFGSLTNSSVVDTNAGAHTVTNTRTKIRGFSLAGTQSSLGGVALAASNINYSLNIANATRNYIEVVGRPTLVATIGSEAKFFAGDEYTFGLSGSSGSVGSFVKYPVGINLQVTPTKLEGEYVTINAVMAGDLLSSLASNPTTAFTTVTHSYVSTSVRAKLGETIVLGGIMESSDTSDTNKTPGLGDIPLLQYAFRNDSTTSERKYVMYLITPRAYTGREADAQAMKDHRDKLVETPNLDELDRLNQDWLPMSPTIPIMFNGLGPVYRCFRYGDVKPTTWSMPEPLEREMEEFVNFIWM